MSDEKFDREMADMKAHIDMLMKLLQESDENQRHGWILKKRKVKWPMLQVKLKHKLSSWLKKEE